MNFARWKTVQSDGSGLGETAETGEKDENIIDNKKTAVI